jgi:hypothetical protein
VSAETDTLMYIPGAAVEIDANRIALIIGSVCGSTPEEASRAANLIVDYLIVTFQQAGTVRLQ